jgi:hypothetical protein
MKSNTQASVRAEAKEFRFQLMLHGFREDGNNHKRMIAPEGMNSRQARSIAHKVFWPTAWEHAQVTECIHAEGSYYEIKFYSSF